MRHDQKKTISISLDKKTKKKNIKRTLDSTGEHKRIAAKNPVI